MRMLSLSRFLPFLFLFATAGRAEGPPKADAAAAGLKTAQLRRLDSLLQEAVDHRQIAGGVALLIRHGKVGYLQAIGWQDAEAKRPMTPTTLFRIASMSKPITTAAALMLVEDGKLRLDDPISKYIPEFQAPKVLVPDKSERGYSLRPAAREITVRHLLTHTSGLTYRFFGKKPLSDLYRQGGVSDGLVHPDGTVAENVRRLAKQPLLFDPGSAFEYSLSTDVLGRVIEVASGEDLAAFFRKRIFAPLKMEDTCFFVPKAKRPRLSALYRIDQDKKIVRVGDKAEAAGELGYSATFPCEEPGTYFSGGAGLVSTAGDYARFLQMLLNRGEWGGVRLLKVATVRRMTANQIGELKFFTADHGDRFGFGLGIVTPAAKDRMVASVGSYSWGGAFHTYFWVDPQKELIGVLMTQVIPYDHLTLRHDFLVRTYESLAD